MRIAIKDIKLSPYQVRDLESDPDLAALAESIEEHDQLVPIKVRPIRELIEGCMAEYDPCVLIQIAYEEEYGTHSDFENWCDFCADFMIEQEKPYWECIFGHRRLAAMEMAGFDEIEAIVSDVDDQEAQIQALIENTQRKDLEAIELAQSLKALKDATGWSNVEIERHGILHRRIAGRILALLEEPDDIQEMIRFDRSHVGPAPEVQVITPKHVIETRASLAEPEPRAKILRKAAKERLTVDQTRKLAQRYESAPTAELKARILEVPVKHQEALETVDEVYEEVKRAAKESKGQKPPMTMSDYVFKLQASMDNLRRFLVGGRQVEIWHSDSWPIVRGLLSDLVVEISEFIQEVENERRHGSRGLGEDPSGVLSEGRADQRG